MATKKKKATKKAPAKKAVREKEKPEVTAKPKAKKAAKAAKTKKDSTKAKRRRIWMSVMVKKDDLTKDALKKIKQADELEVQIADASDNLRLKLEEVTEALGTCSFEHPDRGPMTIMSRGDKTFWRVKPAGVAA